MAKTKQDGPPSIERQEFLHLAAAPPKSMIAKTKEDDPAHIQRQELLHLAAVNYPLPPMGMGDAAASTSELSVEDSDEDLDEDIDHSSSAKSNWRLRRRKRSNTYITAVSVNAPRSKRTISADGVNYTYATPATTKPRYRQESAATIKRRRRPNFTW